MLINQGSCELKDQEMKLMRKISMSNTKAVFKQTIMAMAKDQVFKFSKAAKQRQHHTTCFPPWNFITDSNEITHHTTFGGLLAT